MTITSHHNARLKEIRKLRQRRRWRERSGRFVAEGEDLLAAADAAGWVSFERYCAAGSGLPGVEVEPALLTAASGLASGTRALAVYEERWSERPFGPLCVYLHAVHDPGNVGAIVRSAQAFGASCVAFGPGSADPFGPKAVRASMGGVFSVPLVKTGDGGPGAVTDLPGLKLALVPGAGPSLAEVMHLASTPRTSDVTVAIGAEGGGLARDVTLLIGAERDGLPDDVIEQADQVAHITIQTDSINAAMAATVALYEVTRMARA
jgi:TrmH family RNA methyltransferase